MNDFQYFNSKETSTNCKAYLEINGKQANEILKRGSNIKFTGYHKQQKAVFVIYGDFKSILKKVQKINKNNPNEYYTS